MDKLILRGVENTLKWPYFLHVGPLCIDQHSLIRLQCISLLCLKQNKKIDKKIERNKRKSKCEEKKNHS